MNTKEALIYLLASPARYKAANISYDKAADLRFRLTNGKITLDKMSSILKEAGYTIETDVKWNIPAPKEPSY